MKRICGNCDFFHTASAVSGGDSCRYEPPKIVGGINDSPMGPKLSIIAIFPGISSPNLWCGKFEERKPDRDPKD